MTEEKKSRYSAAQNKATQTYIKKNLENISFRVKKGEKQKYIDAANKMGISMTQLFIRAADKEIEEFKNNH